MRPSSGPPGHRLLEALGRGGMGVVHRAIDERTGEAVALKAICGDASPELIERLRREADAARRLAHPNVVRVLGSGEHRAR